jgi:undecaprenyl-diphosphatase
VLATIPAGILGLAIKKTVEAAFQSSLATGLFLFVTAAFLFTAEWLGKRQRPLESVTWKDALWIGLFQAVSIFPGISRSGSTMAGGLVRNLERQAAARFSFIMSVPIMLAAGLLEAKDLISNPDLIGSLPVILVGFLTAAIVGYFVIRWLLAYLATHSFKVFAYYCIAAGLITVAVSLLR